MSDTSIDYEGLAQNALRGVVRSVLEQVARTGLPANHHFFIAFNTRAPDVGISKRLREQYPDEMTVVLQHRFWDLQVHEDRFEVKLTFGGIPERLVVPFRAIKVFFDPSAHYGLQFEPSEIPAPTKRKKAKFDVISQDREVASDTSPLIDIDLGVRPGANVDVGDTTEPDEALPEPVPAGKSSSVPASGGVRPQLVERKRTRRDADDTGVAMPSSAKSSGKSTAKEPAEPLADAPAEAGGEGDASPAKPTADVVSLDAFRKK